MPRFVVLQHEIGPSHSRSRKPVHWDWMFELGDSLRTWSTDVLKPTEFRPGKWNEKKSTIMPATALEDHRLAYLDIEGDIGGDRGAVSKVFSGSFETIEISNVQFHVATRELVFFESQLDVPLQLEIEFQRRVDCKVPDADPIDTATDVPIWRLFLSLSFCFDSPPLVDSDLGENETN